MWDSKAIQKQKRDRRQESNPRLSYRCTPSPTFVAMVSTTAGCVTTTPHRLEDDLDLMNGARYGPLAIEPQWVLFLRRVAICNGWGWSCERSVLQHWMSKCFTAWQASDKRTSSLSTEQQARCRLGKNNFRMVGVEKRTQVSPQIQLVATTAYASFSGCNSTTKLHRLISVH